MINTSQYRIVIWHLAGAKANQREEFEIPESGEIHIGSDSRAEISFPAVATVNPQHAVIRVSGVEQPEFTLENLSGNGSYLNNSLIRSAKLAAEDHISLGPDGPTFSFDVIPRPANFIERSGVHNIDPSAPERTADKFITRTVEGIIDQFVASDAPGAPHPQTQQASSSQANAGETPALQIDQIKSLLTNVIKSFEHGSSRAGVGQKSPLQTDQIVSLLTSVIKSLEQEPPTQGGIGQKPTLRTDQIVELLTSVIRSLEQGANPGGVGQKPALQTDQIKSLLTSVIKSLEQGSSLGGVGQKPALQTNQIKSLLTSTIMPLLKSKITMGTTGAAILAAIGTYVGSIWTPSPEPVQPLATASPSITVIPMIKADRAEADRPKYDALRTTLSGTRYMVQDLESVRAVPRDNEIRYCNPDNLPDAKELKSTVEKAQPDLQFDLRQIDSCNKEKNRDIVEVWFR